MLNLQTYTETDAEQPEQAPVSNNGSTKCVRCGRDLSNPTSIARGIGPICSGKGYSKVSFRDDGYISNNVLQNILPRSAGDDFYFRRNPADEFDLSHNVPWTVIEHSPDGFEWSYGGSGPSDLALNMVEAVLRETGYKGDTTKCFKGSCFTLSYTAHQHIKRDFVAVLPKAGGTIKFQDVLDYLAQRWNYHA